MNETPYSQSAEVTNSYSVNPESRENILDPSAEAALAVARENINPSQYKSNTVAVKHHQTSGY